MKENTELVKLNRSLDELQEKLVDMNVTTQAENEAAADFLRKIKQTEKIVKSVFEEDRVRTYNAYKAVTDKIKGYADILKKAEAEVRRMMGAYATEQARIQREREAQARREAEEKLLEAAEKTGDEEFLNVDVAVTSAPIEKPAGTHTRTVWHWEVANKDAIPSAYMIVDEKAVSAIVKAKKDAAAEMIPGIRVYSTEEVVVRT